MLALTMLINAFGLDFKVLRLLGKYLHLICKQAKNRSKTPAIA